MAATIKFKRGNSVNLPAAFAEGEPVFAKDTGKLYIGTETGKVLINPDLDYSKGVVPGACATAAAAAAKAVTISGYTPVAGDILAITFTSGNTANSPTLNINSGGAKQIRLAGSQPAGAKSIGSAYCEAGGTMYYCCDGTYFQQLSSSYGFGLTTTAAILKTVNIADLQAEIDALPKIIRHSVLFNVNPGTIAASITIPGFTLSGTGSLTIIGASDVAATTHNIVEFIVENNMGAGNIIINGFAANVTSDNAVGFRSRYNNCVVKFQYCTAAGNNLNNTSGFYVFDSPGVTSVEHCNISNKNRAVFAYGLFSRVNVYNLSGSGNNFIYAAYNSVINLQDAGTVTGGSFINVWGCGVVNPPNPFMHTCGGNSNGYSIVMTAGGLTVVGAGESPIGFADLITNGGTFISGEPMGFADEVVDIMADTNVLITTNAQTLADRKVLRFGSSGYIEPLVTESFSLGGSSLRFNNVYAKNVAADNLKTEQGTWTITLRGETTAGTYTLTTDANRYYRIGYLCYFTCSFTITAIPTAGAGPIQIRGLPYTPNHSWYDSLVSILELKVVDIPSDAGTPYNLTGLITTNGIYLNYLGNNAGGDWVRVNLLSVSDKIKLTGIYRIA